MGQNLIIFAESNVFIFSKFFVCQSSRENRQNEGKQLSVCVDIKNVRKI